MNKKLISDYAHLLESEMCEVCGCTEPASIAFACARAMKVLGEKDRRADPAKVSVKLRVSRGVYRNASTVKVPFLKMRGVKPAIVCGLFGNDSVFNPFASLNQKNRKAMISMLWREKWCQREPLDKPGLFVETEIKYGKNTVRVTIEEKHDNIKKVFLNGKSVLKAEEAEETVLKIESLEQIRNIVSKKISELEKIALKFLNKQAAIIKKMKRFSALDETERLIKNRMEGGNLPVQTFTGSGNQGLFISVSFYKLYVKYGRRVIPSFLFTLLTQIYMTQQKGRISSLCGLSDKCAQSLTAGLSYWKGDNLETIIHKMNLAGEVFRGMLCEGAQKSCA